MWVIAFRGAEGEGAWANPRLAPHSNEMAERCVREKVMVYECVYVKESGGGDREVGIIVCFSG